MRFILRQGGPTCWGYVGVTGKAAQALDGFALVLLHLCSRAHLNAEGKCEGAALPGAFSKHTVQVAPSLGSAGTWTLGIHLHQPVWPQELSGDRAAVPNALWYL